MIPVVIAGCFSSGVLGAGLVYSMTEGLSQLVGVGVMVALDALTLVGFIAWSQVSEEVTVADGVLTGTLGVGNLRLRSTNVELAEVERVRVQTEHNLNRGCVVVSDQAALRLGRGLDEPALQWLRDWVQCHLP